MPRAWGAKYAPRPDRGIGHLASTGVDFLVVLVVLAVIVLVVGAPLRRRGVREAEESAERAELEAAREAKYRQIRDAELDYRTGKLSDADWRAQDRALRAEAMDILHRLDGLY